MQNQAEYIKNFEDRQKIMEATIIKGDIIIIKEGKAIKRKAFNGSFKLDGFYYTIPQADKTENNQYIFNSEWKV